MGGLFSKKSKPDSFEKALSDIEKKIRKAELRLFDLKVRQRRVKVAFIWYSLTVYAISLLLILTYARPNTENTRDVVSKVVPLICGPVVIYYTLHLITLYYERSHRNQEAEIDNLKAKKKLKIEELKEQTAYYLTKGLLERYESGENSMNEPPNEQLRQLESMQNENAHGPPPNGPPFPNGIPGPISPTSPTPGQFYEGPGMPPFRSQSDLHTQHTSASDLISLPSPSNVPQGWFDKLIDKLLGDDGSEENQKYALICSQCHRHNGLVRPDDIEDTHFFCRYCNHHNEPHRKSQLKLQSQNLSQSLPSLPSDISLSASGGLQERKENLEAKQYSKSVDSLAEKSANLHGKISPQTKPKAKAPSPQKPSNAIPPEPSSSSSIESSSQRSSTSSSSVPTAVSSAIPNNTETLRKRNPGKNDNAAHDTPSTDETDSLKTDQSPLSSKQSSPSKPSNPSSSPDPAFSVSDSSSVKDTSPKSAEESKSSAPATPKRSRKKSKGSRKSKNRKEAVGSEIASEQSEVGESTGDDEIS